MRFELTMADLQSAALATWPRRHQLLLPEFRKTFPIGQAPAIRMISSVMPILMIDTDDISAQYFKCLI